MDCETRWFRKCGLCDLFGWERNGYAVWQTKNPSDAARRHQLRHSVNFLTHGRRPANRCHYHHGFGPRQSPCDQADWNRTGSPNKLKPKFADLCISDCRHIELASSRDRHKHRGASFTISKHFDVRRFLRDEQLPCSVIARWRQLRYLCRLHSNGLRKSDRHVDHCGHRARFPTYRQFVRNWKCEPWIVRSLARITQRNGDCWKQSPRHYRCKCPLSLRLGFAT
jgi:hypothetical protein